MVSSFLCRSVHFRCVYISVALILTHVYLHAPYRNYIFDKTFHLFVSLFHSGLEKKFPLFLPLCTSSHQIMTSHQNYLYNHNFCVYLSHLYKKSANLHMHAKFSVRLKKIKSYQVVGWSFISVFPNFFVWLTVHNTQERK